MARARDAGLARRLAALAIDVAIALSLLGFSVLVATKAGLAERIAWSGGGAFVIVLVLGSCVVLAWRHLAGTPGALLMGVNVVRARDGGRMSVSRASLRLLIALGLAGLGLLWCVGGRRALHDRITGTRAVLEDDVLVSLDEHLGRIA